MKREFANIDTLWIPLQEVNTGKNVQNQTSTTDLLHDIHVPMKTRFFGKKKKTTGNSFGGNETCFIKWILSFAHETLRTT